MSKYRRYTRRAKHNKRENHKKKILFFGSLAILFLIIFGSLILFGNKGNPTQEVTEQEENETADEETGAKEVDNEEENEEEEQEEVKKPRDKNLEPAEKEKDEDEITLKEIESTDSNVKKAYEGDWDPIGTTQEGSHTTVYESGSDDRKEIKEAVIMVTDLEEDNIVEHWIGRGGEDKVIATVSDNNYEEIYKVYLQWVDEEGWQPTKYEELNHYP